MNIKKIIPGLTLILLGIFLICNKALNLNLFNIGNLWPLFVLIPGLSFEISFFIYKKNPGTLVPGGILTIIGLLFFFENSTNWSYSLYTWPIYIFAVAFGLFQSFIFSEGKNISTLTSALFLAVLSVIFFIMMIYGEKAYKFFNIPSIIGIIFIFSGISLLLKSLLKKQSK